MVFLSIVVRLCIVFAVCTLLITLPQLTGFSTQYRTCRHSSYSLPTRQRTVVKSCCALQSASLDSVTLELGSTAVNTAVAASSYEPPQVGAEIWIGSAVALVPIIWATFEFVGRIRVQQRCAVCQGSGLTKTTKAGKTTSRLRKCWNCGGFLPWLGWKAFFLSSFGDVGNGGVLQRPAKDYLQTNAKWKASNPVSNSDTVPGNDKDAQDNIDSNDGNEGSDKPNSNSDQL